eukprot:TRINITY_DN10736_c0_g1_i1.p1 TRINITY_DN10736_c0_g1~~TRINITY_DN10736_c0_g1_i1.p1  ORF type:complete len:191 (-),score=29.24 TRINITY_DN10736_c0_g1_i1:53-625(-)
MSRYHDRDYYERSYPRSVSDHRDYNRGYDRYGRNYDREYGYNSGNEYSLAPSYRSSNYNDDYLGGNSLSTFGSNSTSLSGFNPSVDLSETEREWIVHAEIPGIEKQNVHVSCENGRLTISGERARASNDAGRTWHRSERTYGTFSRTLTLPTNVDNKDIRANFLNGVLEVSIPKPAHYLERENNRRINIA